jgi:hypothetical protein
MGPRSARPDDRPSALYTTTLRRFAARVIPV